MKHSLKFFSIVLNILLGLFAVLWVASYFKLKSFPTPDIILPEITSEPTQFNSNDGPFAFSYEGESYQLIPKANYTIKGLVATHNNVAGIGDAYHTSKSVDLKDICLLWGENALSSNLAEIQFWSEPWSCHFKTDRQDVYESFLQNKISNNHLLAANDSVRDTIKKVKVWDQIEMQGLLVDYYPQGASEMLRRTSLNRDDTGNGACEILYVQDIKILQEWQPFYSAMSRTSAILFLFTCVLKVISLFLFPYLEYRSI